MPRSLMFLGNIRMLENQGKAIPPVGSKLRGIVCRFCKEFVLIDIGNGILGFLTNHEISLRFQTQNNKASLQVGDELNIIIRKVSHSKTSNKIFIRLTLKNAFETPVLGSRLNAKVTKLAKFGVFVLTETGAKALVHNSEIFSYGPPWPTPDNVLKIDDWIEVIIIFVDDEKGQFKASYRQAQPSRLFETIERVSIGVIYKVTVVKFTDGGLKVRLENGLFAFIPPSEISWTVLKPKAENYFQLNQKIDIIITAIDIDKNKLTASWRLLLPNPWDSFLELFPIGTIIPAIVASSKKYGFFLTLPNGVVGLLHTNQITQEISSIYVGMELFVKVFSFDKETRRIGLTQV